MPEPSETAKRLAEVAIDAHVKCPSLEGAGWEPFGSPRGYALHHVALAIDAAGLREAEDFIRKCSERYWHMGIGGKLAACQALAALRGSKAQASGASG